MVLLSVLLLAHLSREQHKHTLYLHQHHPAEFHKRSDQRHVVRMELHDCFQKFHILKDRVVPELGSQLALSVQWSVLRTALPLAPPSLVLNNYIPKNTHD